MSIKEEALKLSYSFVVENDLGAFANLCRRLQQLYEIPIMLGYQEEFQLTESLNTCVHSFVMNLEPAILVNFVKDRPLDDCTVPAIYGDILNLSKAAMLRSETFFSAPLRDETLSILTTFTGLGQDLSLAIPQTGTLKFVSSGNGQGCLIPMEQGTMIGASAGISRPPLTSTLSSLIASLPYPEQLDVNTSSMASVLEGTNFFELTSLYDSLETVYGSSGQMQSLETGLADLDDLDDLLVPGSASLGPEITRLLGDTAELLNMYEGNSNDQSDFGSPGSIPTPLATDLEFDTLFSEFLPGLPSSGPASGTTTPQQTQNKFRHIRPAHTRNSRDSPGKRTAPRPRRRAARVADKENAVTA